MKVYIFIRIKHRLSNPTKRLILIEVQSGSYLREDDIKDLKMNIIDELVKNLFSIIKDLYQKNR